MINFAFRSPGLLLLALFLALGSPVLAAAPNDAAALTGLTSAKAVFDVRTKEPGRLLFIVKVIDETYQSMLDQGVTPDFVVSFRGGTLPLLRKDPDKVNSLERTMLSEVRERIAAWGKGPVKAEACNVAGRIFKVTPEQLAPGVSMVGNSLISLIGYQNRGYALVP
ncbi:MAG: hypothetical protein D6751_02340, partial [Deltaproteobacteria bacterium]